MKYTICLLALGLLLTYCRTDEESIENIITDPDQINEALIFPDGARTIEGTLTDSGQVSVIAEYSHTLQLIPEELVTHKSVVLNNRKSAGVQVQVAGASSYYDVPITKWETPSAIDLVTFRLSHSPNLNLGTFDLIFRVYDDKGELSEVKTTKIVKDPVDLTAFCDYQCKSLQVMINGRQFCATDHTVGTANTGSISPEGNTLTGLEVYGFTVQPVYAYESLSLDVLEGEITTGSPTPATLTYFFSEAGEDTTVTSQNIDVTFTEFDAEENRYQATFAGELVDANNRTYTLTDGIFSIEGTSIECD